MKLHGYMPTRSGNSSLDLEERNSRWCLILCYVSACTYMSDVMEMITWPRILPGDMQLKRCQGLMEDAYQILNKERNKNIIDVLNIIAVKSLIERSDKLSRNLVDQNTDQLTVDRYGVVSCVHT